MEERIAALLAFSKAGCAVPPFIDSKWQSLRADFVSKFGRMQRKEAAAIIGPMQLQGRDPTKADPPCHPLVEMDAGEVLHTISVALDIFDRVAASGEVTSTGVFSQQVSCAIDANAEHVGLAAYRLAKKLTQRADLHDQWLMQDPLDVSDQES